MTIEQVAETLQSLPPPSPPVRVLTGYLFNMSASGAGSGEISIYNSATGARVRSVTTGRDDAQPSWSPDGKHIVFTRGRSIYVVSAAGGAARRIVAAGIQPLWVSGQSL